MENQKPTKTRKCVLEATQRYRDKLKKQKMRTQDIIIILITLKHIIKIIKLVKKH